MWKSFLIFDLLKKWKYDNHNRYYFYKEMKSQRSWISSTGQNLKLFTCTKWDSTGGCKATDRQRIDTCPLYLLFKHNYHLKFVSILFTRHCNILKLCLILFTRHCSIWENCATILHSFWQQVIPSMTRSLNNSSPVTLHWETVNMHPNLTP